jgi:DNA polymerase elongation subunit (family B)
MKKTQEKSINFHFDEIESIECIGMYDDEYVYDIEVDDDSHTFIGNDILIHNSIFLSFNEFINANRPDIAIEDHIQRRDLIIKMFDIRLADYIKKGYDHYAKITNTINIQDFELENIHRVGIMLGKKKYAMDTIWKMPGTIYEPLSKIKFKGVEIIRSDTPHFAREILKEEVKNILNLGDKITLNDLIIRIKKIKEEFLLKSIDDIAQPTGINNYEEYVLKDSNVLKIKKGCPMHVRASAVYNHLLHQNAKFQNKYKFIHSKDKIQYYPIKQGTKYDYLAVFGFPIGEFPLEFAPEIDYDVLFNKSILDPLNRFVAVLLNGTQIPENLVFHKKLF